MTLAEHMARGLFVGWQFLRFDPSAIKFLEMGGRGALRSFLALAFTLPIYALSVYLVGLDVNTPRFAATPMAALLAGHILVVPLFAVVMFYLARMLGLGGRFTLFLSAYNWSRVYALLLLLPAEVLIGFRLFPSWADNLLLVATASAVIFYQSTVARVALNAGHFHGVLIAIFDWVLIFLVEATVKGFFVPPA
ncbi:MAG: hypothetical protein V3R73_05045, partial [Sphingomonadales bacterium]